MRALRVLRHDQRGYALADLLITIAILGLVMAAVLGVQLTSNIMFLRGENQAEAQQGARAAMLMEEDVRMVGYGCPDNGCPTDPVTLNYSATGTPMKISAASATSITAWADTLNASTTLCAAATAGATSLTVADASGIVVGDRIYLDNGGTWESKTVTGKAVTVHIGPPCAQTDTLTVAGLTNAYPQGVQVGRPRKITYQLAANALCAANTAGNTLCKDAGDGSGLQPLATGVTGLAYTYYVQPDPQPLTPITLTGNPPSVPTASLSTIGRIQITTSTQSAQSASGPSTFSINTNVRPRNL